MGSEKSATVELSVEFTYWLRSTDASGVLRRYVVSQARLQAVGSLTGRFGEGPPATCGSSGEREILAGLVKGVTSEMLGLWHYLTFGYTGHTDRLDALIELRDGEMLALLSKQADAPQLSDVAAWLKLPFKSVVALHRESLQLVHERLSEFKYRDREAQAGELHALMALTFPGRTRKGE